MKVLHLMPYVTVGGAEAHLLTLSQAQRTAGLSPSLAVLQARVADGARSLYADFASCCDRVVDLDLASRLDPRQWSRLRALIRDLRPDLLHSHLPRADLAAALLRLSGCGVPWVASVHGVYARTWRAAAGIGSLARAWRRADGVIAISHAVSRWLTKGCGVPTTHVHVVHYGIEWQPFAGAAARRKRRPAAPLIGTMGRIDPVKGHETLIRAMPAVVARWPAARLRIAGHDPFGYGARLRELAVRLGVADRVELCGFVDDVAAFFADLDVFAFASRSEGFGQVVIEAMAAGLPVVASRIDPLTEIVRDGRTGLLVTLDDADAFAGSLLALLSDPARAAAMGLEGQRHVADRFSVERMSRDTGAVYAEVVNRHLAASAVGTAH